MLTAFEERFIEWNDGIIGNAPEEGVRLFFPADPALFVDSFFDIAYDVEIFNDTPDQYLIMDVSQDTGPVAKGESEAGRIVIDGDLLIGENDMVVENREVVVDGCTLTIDGVHVLDRLTLTNSATLTHSQGSMGMALTVLETATIPEGSKVDVNAKGMMPRPDGTGRSGGSYGGRGQNAYGESAPTYGDALWPSDLGSGGTGDGITRGGGRIQISADLMTLDGELRANGADGWYRLAGGSGGSLVLDVGMLSGVGVLQANGGVNGSESGAGGGGRVAVYAQTTEGFSPSALEAKSGGPAAQWGTAFMGIPRTVAVTCTGQGVCDPAGPVAIPYGGMAPFAFNPMPASLSTNGMAVPPDMIFEWVNTGLWRGTLEDAAWLEKLNGNDTLDAAFEALAAGQVAAQPGGGMAVTVNGLAGWRYTLERRESLTEGEWLPVTGQTEILCGVTGPLVLTDAAVLPQAFYRVVAMP